MTQQKEIKELREENARPQRLYEKAMKVIIDMNVKKMKEKKKDEVHIY